LWWFEEQSSAADLLGSAPDQRCVVTAVQAMSQASPLTDPDAQGVDGIVATLRFQVDLVGCYGLCWQVFSLSCIYDEDE